MNFVDIRDAIVKLGLPLLGQALPLPGGAALGTALANYIGSPSDKPNDILATLTQSAEALQKAREFEATNQQILLKIQVDAEIAASQEVTKRWQADMLSDSSLSKNIRPASLIAVITIVTFFATLSAFEIKIENAYVILFGDVFKIMVAAYFIGRSAEKGVDIYQGWKQTQGK